MELTVPRAVPCDEHPVGHVVAGGTAVRARAQCSSSPVHHSMDFWLSCPHPSACSQVPQLTEGLMVLVLSAGQTRAAGLARSCRAAWLGWVPWLGGQTWAVWAAWRAGECCVMLPRPHSDPRECGAGSCCIAQPIPSFISAGAAGLPWGPGADW